MPRQNYRQMKKQKELTRKARQLDKQQRRTARPNASAEIEAPAQERPVDVRGPTSSSGT